jgi:hypothetical protein
MSEWPGPIPEAPEVEVVRGPLVGVRGKLLRRDSARRIVLAVTLIRQSAVVEVHSADVGVRGSTSRRARASVLVPHDDVLPASRSPFSRAGSRARDRERRAAEGYSRPWLANDD